MKGLQGKVAIVTGGATLIGSSVVEVLRGFGLRVAVFDIDAVGGAKAVSRDPAATRFWPVDITDDMQLAVGVGAVADHFGRIDHLVNLACTYTDNGAEASRADWQFALDVNVISAVMLARAVRPQMLKQGGGAIVNFTSISAGSRRRGAGCIRSPRPRWCR
jgi:NAD(P)-dependent dehydrogenase (short-subunit alcohol dehydrogenase family)